MEHLIAYCIAYKQQGFQLDPVWRFYVEPIGSNPDERDFSKRPGHCANRSRVARRWYGYGWKGYLVLITGLACLEV